MTTPVEITRDLETCFALRRIVFIGEQQIPEAEEFDALDDTAVHLLVRNAAGEAVGTARLITEGTSGKIGRVCVLRSERGTGAGAALIRFAVEHFRNQAGIARVKLSAQTYAIGFYEKLGFDAYGLDYNDCGIAHRDMELLF